MCACVLLLRMSIWYQIGRVWPRGVIEIMRDRVVLATSGVLVLGCAALAAVPRGERDRSRRGDARAVTQGSQPSFWFAHFNRFTGCPA